MTRTRAGLLVAALVALAVPGTAAAGTLDYQNGTAVFTASAGETNQVFLTNDRNQSNTLVLGVTDFQNVITLTAAAQSAGCIYTDDFGAPQPGPTQYTQCPGGPVNVTLGDGADTLSTYGENASDTLAFPVTASGGDANDDMAGGGQADALDGGAGDDNVRGDAGNDTVSGGPGNDTLLGHLGNDTLNGGDGNDSFDAFNPVAGGNESAGADNYAGGPGEDRVTFALRSDSMTITFDGQANDGAPGEGDMYNDDVEIVVSGNGDDTLIGNDGAQQLYGSFGHDTIDGRGGNDIVDGSEGSDVVNGGAGNDRVEGDDGADALDGGAGADEIIGDDSGGDPGPDTVSAADGEADLVLCGGATDNATVDQLDNVERQSSFRCENVTVQNVTPGGGGPNGGGGDTTAPAGELVVGRGLRVASFLRRGVPFRVQLDEAATVRATLRIDSRTARRLGLGRRAVTIGRTTRQVAAGTSSLRVGLSRREAGRLRRSRALRRMRTLRVELVIVATDAAGNASQVRRVVTIRR